MAALAVGLLTAGSAQAQSFRRTFEPTDLEVEGPGTIELDMQSGLVRGPDAFRLTIPDAELDIGLTRTLELDVDGAFALEGPSDGRATYDHIAPDNLWVALKWGLLGYRDSDSNAVWSLALQMGPKCALAPGAHGLGAEGLFLIGFQKGKTKLALNLGGLIDPATDDDPRPRGIEGGLDLEQGLDQAGHWKFLAEFGGISFRSADPNQASGTAGLAWGPNDDFQVSLVLMGGLLSGSDRYGILLGLSPKFHLW